MLSILTIALIPNPIVPPWFHLQDMIPNGSYLSNTQVIKDDPYRFFGGYKKAVELRQEYEDKTRDILQRQPYSSDDVSLAYIHSNLIQSANSNTYSSAYSVVSRVEMSEYVNNIKSATTRGDISTPILATAGTIGAVTGNDIKVKIDSISMTSNVNLVNQIGTVKVDLDYFGVKTSIQSNVTNTTQVCSARVESNFGIINATFNPNAPVDDKTAFEQSLERYSVTYSKSLPLKVNFGAGYAGSTLVYKVFANRTIRDRITLQVDNSFGNPNIGIIPETVFRVNYNVKF